MDGEIQRPILLRIIEILASEEERNLIGACVDATRQRNRQYSDANEEWSASPSRWATILKLYDFKLRGLRSDWREIYKSWRIHEGSYFQGLAWTFDYYKGRTVDLAWSYESHLPPLWSELAEELRSIHSIKPPPILYDSYLPDWVHLLAVLPMTSANLLKVQQRVLMASHPLFWPTQFSLFDIGASQLWQCEAVIPVIPEEILRGLVKK